MDSDDYYIAGVVLAMSVVHGGPAPRFMANELFQALIGDPNAIKVSVDRLPDNDTARELRDVCYICFFVSLLLSYWSVNV